MCLLVELAKQQVQPTLYSYNVLKATTKDFQCDNKLGEGKFGVVYKVNLSTLYPSMLASLKYVFSPSINKPLNNIYLHL